MADISVTETETPGIYEVTIDDAGHSTRHRVTVPADVASVGLPDVDPERLVTESFAFLLEREPPSAIMREFDLEVIERYFPEYPEVLQRRLS